MHRNTLFSGIFIFCFLSAYASFPENINHVVAGPSFLKQASFVVGFKGGINFSMVSPTQRFSVIQSVYGSDDDLRKDYNPFYNNFGHQYGFIGMVKLNNSLSVSVEPSFATYRYKYSSGVEWYDASDPQDRMTMDNEVSHVLKYFEIPLAFRYELGNGQVRPYLAAGFFYGLLTGVNGRYSITTEQYLDGIAISGDEEESAGDVSGNYIKTRLATYPGIGVFADFSYVTFFAEADYFISLHNIVNESERFSNNQSIGGYYDVPDNLRFNNLVINIGILFNISPQQGGGGKGGAKGAVECAPKKRKR